MRGAGGWRSPLCRRTESLCEFVDEAVAPGTFIDTDDRSGYADLRKRGYDYHLI
jgi:hypothetical protein